MLAESTVKPVAQFDIEGDGNLVDVRFYGNVVKKEVENEDDTEIWQYEEYVIKGVANRPNLREIIESNYDGWLQLAMSSVDKPKPESDGEKLLRLEQENHLLGIDLSEREINEIIQGMQVSDLEIQLLEIQFGGM